MLREERKLKQTMERVPQSCWDPSGATAPRTSCDKQHTWECTSVQFGLSWVSYKENKTVSVPEGTSEVTWLIALHVTPWEMRVTTSSEDGSISPSQRHQEWVGKQKLGIRMSGRHVRWQHLALEKGPQIILTWSLNHRISLCSEGHWVNPYIPIYKESKAFAPKKRSPYFQCRTITSLPWVAE